MNRRIAICPYCRQLVEAELLTPREWEICEMLIGGKPTSAIARELFISTKTVEAHRMKIYAVTGTSTPAGLVRWANDRGILVLMGWDETRNLEHLVPKWSKENSL